MCLTNQYDPDSARHREIKRELMHGIALNEIASFAEVNQALEAVGFEVVEGMDRSMQEDPYTPWYQPMEGDTGTFRNLLRRTPAGRKAMIGMVKLTEAFRLFPKGSSTVIRLMDRTAEAYVAGGKTGIFTPLYCFLARKPVAGLLDSATFVCLPSRGALRFRPFVCLPAHGPSRWRRCIAGRVDSALAGSESLSCFYAPTRGRHTNGLRLASSLMVSRWTLTCCARTRRPFLAHRDHQCDSSGALEQGTPRSPSQDGVSRTTSMRVEENPLVIVEGPARPFLRWRPASNVGHGASTCAPAGHAGRLRPTAAATHPVEIEKSRAGHPSLRWAGCVTEFLTDCLPINVTSEVQSAKPTVAGPPS